MFPSQMYSTVAAKLLNKITTVFIFCFLRIFQVIYYSSYFTTVLAYKKTVCFQWASIYTCYILYVLTGKIYSYTIVLYKFVRVVPNLHTVRIFKILRSHFFTVCHNFLRREIMMFLLSHKTSEIKLLYIIHEWGIK
jgi:hypothetical protein